MFKCAKLHINILFTMPCSPFLQKISFLNAHLPRFLPERRMYGGRSTDCTTAVARTYGGRRTTCWRPPYNRCLTTHRETPAHNCQSILRKPEKYIILCVKTSLSAKQISIFLKRNLIFILIFRKKILFLR